MISDACRTHSLTVRASLCMQISPCLHDSRVNHINTSNENKPVLNVWAECLTISCLCCQFTCPHFSNNFNHYFTRHCPPPLQLPLHTHTHQSMQAEREWTTCRSVLKPIFVTHALCSAPQPSAPCSTPAQAFSGMSAHCSAPAHPIFCPLRSIFRSIRMLRHTQALTTF